MGVDEKKLKLILAGQICPYCNRTTSYVDSSIVYGGLSYGMIYYCEPCRSWVGVHNGTNKALGRLANRELREYKKKAHASFDPIWKTGLINKIWPDFVEKRKKRKTSNRAKAYIWLAKKLEIEPKYCHIGFFSAITCKKLITICELAKNECNLDKN
jgi:hypothetical protein